MVTAVRHRGFTWVDLETPSLEEVRDVMNAYGIHPAVAEELSGLTAKPKVDLYSDALYLVLHFPVVTRGLSSTLKQEVDFFIRRDVLVTAHYEPVEAIHAFSRDFEVTRTLDASGLDAHGGTVFFHLIHKLYRTLLDELDHIESTMLSIEERLFEKREREMVARISEVSRDLIAIDQALTHHGAVLNVLEASSLKLFGEDFGYSMRVVKNEHDGILAVVRGAREFLSELRDTNDSLLSTKQNEIMKVLTIMAFITLPLSLIPQIFGMNIETFPFLGSSYDFWLILGLMAVFATGMFVYFKRKEWL